MCDDPETLLPSGLVRTSVTAGGTGSISAIDSNAIGKAIAAIGGGRTKADDKIDPAVGVGLTVKIGDHVEKSSAMGFVFARDNEQGTQAAERISAAYSISG